MANPLLSVRLDPSVLALLDGLCAAENRTRGNMVEVLVRRAGGEIERRPGALAAMVPSGIRDTNVLLGPKRDAGVPAPLTTEEIVETARKMLASGDWDVS